MNMSIFLYTAHFWKVTKVQELTKYKILEQNTLPNYAELSTEPIF